MSVKRRWFFRLLVYPRFQILLIAMNLGIFLSALTLVGVQFYFTIESLKDLAVKSGLDETHPFYSFLSLKIEQFNFWLLIGLVAALILITVGTLLLSHRVVGPIYRLKTYFKDIKHKGDVLPLSFRKNDYFTDLPQIITSALTHLKEHSSTLDKK